MGLRTVFLTSILVSACAYTPITEGSNFSGTVTQRPFGVVEESPPLISSETKAYAESLLARWNSPGLSLGAVRRDSSRPLGWHHEFACLGIARADGSPVTPDSVFAIASNSKLFLAVSVGLLIHNNTLTDLQGKRLTWKTKMKNIIPQWDLMDGDVDSGATIQDLLSHRTGLPRHDFSRLNRQDVGDMISTLKYLRPSAEIRETFQYNNLMYSTLSYLPQILLNQSYPSYVAQHLFGPLNMTASTFSVAEAEESGFFADGFQYDMEDITNGKNGTRKPTVPYFQRPGEETTWAGPGGVLTSARDLVVWTSMLLNNGRHPYTNQTVVPEEVIEHVAHGRSIPDGGKPEFPEISPRVYGAGQFRYSYRGKEIIEHGGNNPGYKTQVSRLPEDNLAIIALSNDAVGGFLMEAVKWRVIDDVLGLEPIDWNRRYEKVWGDFLEKAQKHTPRPTNPQLPAAGLALLEGTTFSHPAYGSLQPCFVTQSSVPFSGNHSHCETLLSSPPVLRLLSDTDLTIPTFLMSSNRGFATHFIMQHFDANIFNLTVVWTNWAAREAEKLGANETINNQNSDSRRRDRGDLVLRWMETFEVEWVQDGMEEDGLAFKGGFWGKEGPDSRSPDGVGKDSAEVWFAKVTDG